MKIRDAVFLVIGGLLVIAGMVLNSFLVGDADAQVGGDNTILKNVFCENLIIQDKNGKWRGFFGLASGDAILEIYGDDGDTQVAYLGKNTKFDNEMMLLLKSKSKTDKREAMVSINENGGRFDSVNKMGENVIRLAVGDDGSGGLDVRDKFGYTR
jgi:hypothetical protein